MADHKPCLFLDRDGVIIENVPYTRDPNTVSLMPGVVALIKTARAKNFWVVVVTNQSGLGRGLLNNDDYLNITERMNKYLDEQGVRLDRIYHAPFYEKSLTPEFLEKPHWRKPDIGMIAQACQDFPIDLEKSLMVGDRASDILMAQNAAIGRKILFLSAEFLQEENLIPPGLIYERTTDLSEIKI